MQLLVQVAQVRSEVVVQGPVSYWPAPHVRQDWQVGLDEPRQLPERNWPAAHELARVQLTQARSATAVQVPVRYW